MLPVASSAGHFGQLVQIMAWGMFSVWLHKAHIYTYTQSYIHTQTHTETQTTLSHASLSYISFTISYLFPAFPIPSSSLFGDLLEEIDTWGYPVL